MLVIRSDGKFSALLREAGFDVFNFELVGTRQIDDLAELHSRLQQLSEYDGLFFTSPVAAKIFVRESNRTNGFHGKVYALGNRAKTVLEYAGLSVVYKAQANTAREMLASFNISEFEGKKFLFVNGNRSKRVVPEYLGRYAVVDEINVYETYDRPIARETIAQVAEKISKKEIDWVCFFSSSAVERFVDLFGTGDFSVAVIGITTAEKAQTVGLKVRFVSPRSDTEAFAKGLIEQIEKK